VKKSLTVRIALLIILAFQIGFPNNSIAASNTKHARNQRIIDKITSAYPKDGTPEVFLRQMQPFITKQTFALYSEYFKELKKLGLKRMPNLVRRANNEFLIQYDRHTISFAIDPHNLKLFTFNGRKLDFTTIDDPTQQFEMILQTMPKHLSNKWDSLLTILVPTSNASGAKLLQFAGQFLAGKAGPKSYAAASAATVVATGVASTSEHCETYDSSLNKCIDGRNRLNEMDASEKWKRSLSEGNCKHFMTLDGITIDVPGANGSGVSCGCKGSGKQLEKEIEKKDFFTVDEIDKIRLMESDVSHIFDSVLAQYKTLEAVGCAITESGSNASPALLSTCLEGLEADLGLLCVVPRSQFLKGAPILLRPKNPALPAEIAPK
jgi:hypothetical protein